MKKLLTIAGSDSIGGAGIQADIKTFSALGCYGMSVITAVTAQNTAAVLDSQDISPAMIQKQLEAVFEDVPPDGVKVGMVSVPETIEVIAAALKKYCPPVVVIDPVMVSKSGFHLLRPDAVSAMKKQFLPLGAVLTPNVPEAEILCGRKIESHRDMEAAAEYLYAMGALAVVIKGGHLQGDADDLVYDGKEKIWLPGKRIATKNTHGTGCTISSAIASYMAKGENVAEAVRKAKEYVTGAIQHAIAMGSGCGPTHHFYRIWKEEIQEERKDINDTKKR